MRIGNWCNRIVAPAGQLRLSSDAIVFDGGQPDTVAPWLEQRPVEILPEEALLFLLGSRYCETDLLSDTAWGMFGQGPTGWLRVQAVSDFVHRHLRFGSGLSSPTKSAFQAFQDRQGVCRDFAHLAVLQTGEAKYGKPIIDRVIGPTTSLTDATKCILVSFDSTMRSNLSVGMPIDLVCYERDSLCVRLRHRFEPGDAYFTRLSAEWSEGVRTVFRQLPDLTW